MNNPTGADPNAVPFPKPLKLKNLWPGCAVALFALACIPFSVPIYHHVFLFLTHLPLKGFYAAAVQIPSGMFFGLILASIAILQPARRPAVFVFLIALGLSSVANESLKHATGRARPRYSVLMGPTEKQWIQHYRLEHPGTRMRPQRVDQWLGLKRDHPLLMDAYSAFPSGHANSSFVMATFLSALYPEGRLLWYLAAGGAAVSRVEKTRHWPEDVMFGGALGWMIARLVFSWRWAVRLGQACCALLARSFRGWAGLRRRKWKPPLGPEPGRAV